VAGKQVTPAELLALARERAAQVNPAINAIVLPIDEADARAAGELSGPFAGVPFLIKDLMQEYRGYPTSYGSRALANDVALEHATVTQRFLDAGFVIFGKTNTPEFGAKGITESELWGPARNPWNTRHTPGGSSGGSGAAVAAGIVPAAGANDGGGSIRIPSACNGLVGLKPSRGLTPYGPQAGEPLFGLAVQGAVARTVRDVAGIYDALVGHYPVADYLPAVPTGRFSDAITQEPGKLRIGFSAKSAITASPDPEAVAAVESAAKLLESLGHTVEPIDPPYDDEQLARDFLTIWFAAMSAQLEMTKERLGATDADFEADTLAIAELGRAGGAVIANKALERRHDYVRSLHTFFQTYDFFLTPTLAKPPLEVGVLDTPPALQKVARFVKKAHAGKLLQASGLIGQMIDNNLGWVPYTQLANLTGVPAISVPLHWTASGLPLGVQVVGRLGADADLLQLAAQLEQAQPWIQRFPAPVR